MIALLAKLMDWSAIQAVSLMMPSDLMRTPRLAEALEFLKGPECIPDDSQPVVGKNSIPSENGGLPSHFPESSAA
jgi:hypothetical protein